MMLPFEAPGPTKPQLIVEYCTAPDSASKEVWYRYDSQYSDVKACVVIYRADCVVFKHTPKGVWLIGHDGKDHFVLNDAARRYAYPTIKDAQRSFLRRRRRQIAILTAQLQNAKDARDLAKELFK